MSTILPRSRYLLAWYEGKEVEWRRDGGMNPTNWKSVDEPGFPGWKCATIDFRFKPEVKPNVLKYYGVWFGPHGPYFQAHIDKTPGALELVFDGETRMFKGASIV